MSVQRAQLVRAALHINSHLSRAVELGKAAGRAAPGQEAAQPQRGVLVVRCSQRYARCWQRVVLGERRRDAGRAEGGQVDVWEPRCGCQAAQRCCSCVGAVCNTG